MVRVGNADIGGCAGGDICDHIVVDLAVIRVEPQIYFDIGIQFLEIIDGLLVDRSLRLVGIVFGPECDLIIDGSIKFFRHGKRGEALFSVAACQKKYHTKDKNNCRHTLS